MEEVLQFISRFQTPDNKILFRECACYWFALILHKRFQYSSIYYNPDMVHFATEIDGVLYDITGVVDDEDDGYYDFEIYKKDAPHQDISLIIENCIKLKGGE